jgi:hypothetical protein
LSNTRGRKEQREGDEKGRRKEGPEKRRWIMHRGVLVAWHKAEGPNWSAGSKEA